MIDLSLSQILVLIGACFILKYGSILNPIRDRLNKIKFFKELLSCALCLGFWIGLIFGVLWTVFPSCLCCCDTNQNNLNVILEESLILQNLLSSPSQCLMSFIYVFQCSLIGSGVCWLADHVMKIIWTYLYGPLDNSR